MIKYIFVMQITCIIMLVPFVFILLGPVMEYGLFNSYNDKLTEKEINKIHQAILGLDSVKAFKEAYPSFRESTHSDRGVEYTVQSRNANTGNVLSLYVTYDAWNDREYLQFDEHLECILPDTLLAEYLDVFRWDDKPNNLYMVESMVGSTCLDDDYKPKIVLSHETLQ